MLYNKAVVSRHCRTLHTDTNGIRPTGTGTATVKMRRSIKGTEGVFRVQ